MVVLACIAGDAVEEVEVGKGRVEERPLSLAHRAHPPLVWLMLDPLARLVLNMETPPRARPLTVVPTFQALPAFEWVMSSN